MSDSIPKPASAADESLAPGLPPSAASPRWWIASLAFHGVLLAWLVFFSPVRVFDPNAKPAARQVSADRAREVVEQIRETQADSLEQNLRSLEDIRGKIAELENRKRTEFAAFAREMGKDAPAKAAAEQQTIAQAQAEALAAIDKAGENAAHFVQTRAGAFFDDVADAQKLAREQQTRILQMQEQAQAVLSLGGDRFASARDAQAEAAAAQDRAAKALVEAEAARDAARAGRKRTAREGQIEHFSYHLRRAKDGVVNADKNLATWKKELTIAEAVTAATGAAAAEAAKKAAADPDATAQAAAATAQKAVERAERELADARKRVDEAPKTLEAARKNLPELEAKVAELVATPEPEPVAATPEDGKFIEVQAAARQLQLTAQEAQAKAAQAIAAIRDTNGGDGSGAAALADLDKAAPSEPAPPAADTGHMNLAQIYERAVQNEGALTQSYRRLRATDLAMIRRLPLAKAVQLTEVAKVIRPDLKEALQASVESGEDVAAAREAVQTAKGEISAIVRLASSLLSQAQGIDRSEGSTVSTEEYNTQFEQWEKMQTLAAEDEGAWAKDLTAAMEGGEGAAGEGKPGGEAGDGTAGGADGAGAGTAGGGCRIGASRRHGRGSRRGRRGRSRSRKIRHRGSIWRRRGIRRSGRFRRGTRRARRIWQRGDRRRARRVWSAGGCFPARLPISRPPHRRPWPLGQMVLRRQLVHPRPLRQHAPRQHRAEVPTRDHHRPERDLSRQERRSDPLGVSPVRQAERHAADGCLQRRGAGPVAQPRRQLREQPAIRHLLRLHRAMVRAGVRPMGGHRQRRLLQSVDRRSARLVERQEPESVEAERGPAQGALQAGHQPRALPRRERQQQDRVLASRLAPAVGSPAVAGV